MCIRDSLKGYTIFDINIKKMHLPVSSKQTAIRSKNETGVIDMTILHLGDRTGEQRDAEPVSYTHLDVYKRQG